MSSTTLPPLVYKPIDSPVGRLTLAARHGKLAAILWEHERPNRVRLGEMSLAPEDSTLSDVERQLGEYFRGERSRFEIELDPVGTEFQRRVWTALLAIPYGETRSYLQMAEELGDPKATRAVGAANGRNPISIVIPCHRLIGSSGRLTGFAGGLEAKAFLLALESRG